MHFGLTDSEGVPKPQLRELKAFAEVLEEVDFAHCHRPDTDTALVVSSYLDTVYPFTRAEDRAYVERTGRQAWIAARLADAPPAVVRESDGITDGHRLYLVPSAKQLLSPTWYRLEELARAGATVYVSYSPGAHDEQRGPWYAHTTRSGPTRGCAGPSRWPFRGSRWIFWSTRTDIGMSGSSASRARIWQSSRTWPTGCDWPLTR
ncbi:hypothetical protein [Streptomyces sp. GC420]|uniref:hypothetical protein n=1 Tax=Streptomyces sp. GC420 TaxID=2697568 RepID=UPI001FB80D16|nr:hypothetical protein [Streptomyces sp. GC420]